MKRRFLRRHLGQRIVVHTRDDQSLRGVLTGVHTDVLVLDVAEHLGPTDAAPVEGRSVVPHSNFAWAQLLGGTS